MSLAIKTVPIILITGVIASCCSQEDASLREGPSRDRLLPKLTTRAALLNFGRSDEQLRLDGEEGPLPDTIGEEIQYEDWREALASLEVVQPDLVIVRVNIGAGHFDEIARFQRFFARELTPLYRTVAWIDGADNYAATAVLPIETFLFEPTGVFGPLVPLECWSTRSVPSLADYLEQSTIACQDGRHPVEVIRAMQVVTPLAAFIDGDTVRYSNHLDGPGEVLATGRSMMAGWDAQLAHRWKFSVGTASTPAEVLSSLGVRGYETVEWVGVGAAARLNLRMKSLRSSRDGILRAMSSCMICVANAEESTDPAERLRHASMARDHLGQVSDALDSAPEFRGHFSQESEALAERLRPLLRSD